MVQRGTSLLLPLGLLMALLALVVATSLALPPAASISDSPTPSGTLSGYIRDANTGAGLPGYVYVYDADDPSVEYEAFADPSGYYAASVPAGVYDVYGALVGYYRLDGSAVITAGETTHLDFDLPAPLMAWSPQTISETMSEGEIREVTLLISNTGSGDLLYRLDEIAPETGLGSTYYAGSLPNGVDPQVYADLAASPEGTAEILVVMAEQADLSAAQYISDWSARGRYVYDRLRATAERSQAQIRRYLEGAGAAYRSHISLNSLTLTASGATVDALAARPEVGAIRPGYVYNLPEPVIQPSLAPQFTGWNVQKIEADRVWATFGATGESIVVASIDTGVEWDHETLKEQYRGWDGATADHDYNWWDPRRICVPADEPCDNYWHGTHTMGTMVGSDDPAHPNSASNAIGVAPGARWIACKGCEMAQGWPCSTFALLECADFMLAPWDQNQQHPNPDLRPHVINNSWGDDGSSGWYYEIVAAWRAAGIFAAFSAGNAGPNCQTVNSPGDYDNSFATGATDSSDNIASFSSRGPSGQGEIKPDVTAPGVYVRSSIPGNSYGGGSGTSMASPHSAGEVALIWSAQPQLVGQVSLTERLIEDTAEGLTTPQECSGVPGSAVPNNTYGWGRIDAYNAVSASLAYDWDVDWLAASPSSGTVAAGEAISVHLLLDGASPSSLGCHSAQLKIETNDPYQGLDVSVPITICLESSGLFITKDLDSARQQPGELVTYTLSFGNDGPEDAVGVTISDPLPAEVELAWASPAGIYTSHELLWGPLTLTAGARITATVVVTLDAEVPDCTWIANSAYMRYKAMKPLVATASHATLCHTYLPLNLYFAR